MFESEPRSFDLIVFDFDGTLADTRPAIAATLAHVLSELVQRAPNEVTVHRLIGEGLPLDRTLEALAREAGYPLSASALLAATTRYRALYPIQSARHARLFTGFESVLRRLKKTAVRLALVSNKGEAAVRSFLEDWRVSSCFDLVVGEVVGRPRKPDPALLTDYVLPHFHVPPEATLIVGDTEADLKFARAAGAASCWARFGYGHSKSCIALAPDFVLDRPEDLVSAVRSL